MSLRALPMICAATAAMSLPVAANAADDAATLACLQDAFEIVDVEYRVEGFGFPKVFARVRNGLDWPVKGFKVDYVVTDPATAATMLDDTTIGETDEAIAPGEEREFLMTSVYVGSLGNDADAARETIKAWDTKATLRDILDGDDRQVLKDGAITMASYQKFLSERTCK